MLCISHSLHCTVLHVQQIAYDERTHCTVYPSESVYSPLQYMYLYLQCTCTYSVQRYLYIHCTSKYNVPYMYVQYSIPLYTVFLYVNVPLFTVYLYIRTLVYEGTSTYVHGTSKYNVPPLTWGVPLSIMYPICMYSTAYLCIHCSSTYVFVQCT